MAHSEVIKNKARALRSKGKTYSEIMRELKLILPKSTISSWCADVVLPEWYQDKIDKLNQRSFNKARKIAWAANKIKRERFLTDLLAHNKGILKKTDDMNVLKMLLSVLYLGEGSKWRSHSGLMLGSSDPDIVHLYIYLLRLCYGIKSGQLKCRISYRADQDINALQNYWSRITSIPLKNFYKTKPDPRTIGKPTKRKDYKGVCVVSSAGTHIQLELEMIPKIILEKLITTINKRGL